MLILIILSYKSQYPLSIFLQWVACGILESLVDFFFFFFFPLKLKKKTCFLQSLGSIWQVNLKKGHVACAV